MLRVIALAALLCTSCQVFQSGPDNLSDLKREVDAYSKSGEYERDVAQAVSGADRYLRKRASKGGLNLTVIFDIDETVLSNLPHMRETDWGYQSDQWNKWVDEAKCPPITPLQDLYNTAIANDIDVVFLTGRTEDNRSGTIRNLRAHGMGEFEQLILRPKRGTAPYEKAVIFKSRVRKNLIENDYTIIANFGDQDSDLEGGYSDRTYKIPNPFYRIP